MDKNEFKKEIANNRKILIPSVDELVYSAFKKLKYDTKNRTFFINNASEIIESLRKECWDTFKTYENKLNSHMYGLLISSENYDMEYKTNSLDIKEILINFLNKYSSHTYDLNLSNTNSRRSRAGNEFERMIELILMGAEIPFDTQGSIGADVFDSSQLAKLVDCVSPGANEYQIDKRNTSLISAKTTLRERWQEVGDEMQRTKAREMFLATVDDSISNNVLDLLSTNNIIVVTTKNLKLKKYKTHTNAITFETMIEELLIQTKSWEKYNFSDEQLKEKYDRYSSLAEKFKDYTFINDYYKNLAKKIKNDL